VIDAASSFGQRQVSMRSLAGAFPRARWVRAFNSLSVNVMADDNHREPPWVLFLSGDQEAKPAVAQLIRDAGFDPVDLGGIDASALQDPGSALWTYALTHDEGARRADKVRGRGCGRSADGAIREVPRPCTRRSRVLSRAFVARGLRGRGTPRRERRHRGHLDTSTPAAGQPLRSHAASEPDGTWRRVIDQPPKLPCDRGSGNRRQEGRAQHRTSNRIPRRVRCGHRMITKLPDHSA
jgi:hypothetical protein